MSRIFRPLIQGALVFLLLGAGPLSVGRAIAQAGAPKIEEFVRVADYSNAALSPDGTLIGMLIVGSNGRRQLAIVEAGNLGTARVVAAFSDADVGQFEWISDRRLAFQAADSDAGGGDQRAPGLFAVDRDGTDFRQLVDREHRGFQTGSRQIGDRRLPWNTFLVGPTYDRSSDDVFVMQIQWDRSYRPGDELPASILMRLNTRTGDSSNLSLGAPSGFGSWLVDASGQPRVRVITRSGQISVHYRGPKEERWRVLTEFPEISGDGFVPVRIQRDNTILVSATNGRDRRALYTFDPSTNRMSSDAVVAVQGFDFDGSTVWDVASDRLLGVHVNADGAATVWLDPRMQEIQKRIDATLPGTTNRIQVALRPATSMMLVESYSDMQPPFLSIYNADKRTLIRIARSRPGIDPKLVGSTDFVRFMARDGLEVPMYYTIPPATFGKANLPTVVLLHGGPWARGKRWGWDSQAQLLASRGYVVLEPEFRGSTGYGFNHFKAGWKQWGLAMQDDVTDAARWAITKGLTDPKRVCVAGASYGGYAALMALAKEPGLFRCGVAWVAVTDIDLLFSSDWTDITDSARRYGMATLIGDPVKDSAQLKAASPVANASKIRQPLLLAYGGADLRVPIAHGRRFRDALSTTNSNVEWVVYGDEGHGWNKLETRLDFWTRVERFLGQNLGAAIIPAK
jgi:dipeptidyl aminopeptidase/acylaminoacyl peptidase